MKKLIYLGLFLVTLTFSSCIIVDETCVFCDIYDEDGYFVKDYGEYCGSIRQAENFADDADEHAFRYYDGWADCYFD